MSIEPPIEPTRRAGGWIAQVAKRILFSRLESGKLITGHLSVTAFTALISAALALPTLAQVPPANIPPLPEVSGPATPLLAAWTQFVSDPDEETEAAKIIQARFVLLGDHKNCDAVTVERPGTTRSTVPATLRGHMQGFDPATEEKFTVTVCVASLPETWAFAHLKTTDAALLTVYPSGRDATLPGPAALSSTAALGDQPALSGVVMADTGCRGKFTAGGSRYYQDCQTDWPFPQIVIEAANDDPDFVFHLGDYHYFFENATEFWDKDQGRDRFEYWLQEFFVPAQPLLMKAPWILARGNHERCKDHRWFGEGWHILFSNMSLEGTDSAGNPVALRPCYDTDPSGNKWVAPTWAVDFNVEMSPATPPWRVVVIDSSQPSEASNGFARAGVLNSAHGRNAFWLSHYPPVKMVYYRSTPGFGDRSIKVDAAKATDCDAPYACRPKAIFSGHQHLYQEITWIDREAARHLPRVIIAGNGGTKLDASGLPGYTHGKKAKASIHCTQRFPDVLPGGQKHPFGFGADQMARLRTASHFGYILLQRDLTAPRDLGWRVTPKWFETVPAFPPAEAVHCDGTPIEE